MLRAALLALALLLPALGAAAQTQADKKAAIAEMLDALRSAPDEDASRRIESRLRRMQIEAGTAAVTLLMARGLRELSAGQHEEAIAAFDDAIVLDPDLAEAFHQRAVARFRAGDSAAAMADLAETLKREPRAYAAFRTMAEIFAAREDWKQAHAAWRKALELAPHMAGGQEKLRELERQAFGRDA